MFTETLCDSSRTVASGFIGALACKDSRDNLSIDTDPQQHEAASPLCVVGRPSSR